MNKKETFSFTTDSGLLKLVKTHGLPFVLMLGGLLFLNTKLDKAEKRITMLEAKLFDCYEKRISASAIPFKEPALFMLQQYAVLPNKKKRNDYTFI